MGDDGAGTPARQMAKTLGAFRALLADARVRPRAAVVQRCDTACTARIEAALAYVDAALDGVPISDVAYHKCLWHVSALPLAALRCVLATAFPGATCARFASIAERLVAYACSAVASARTPLLAE